MSLSGAYLKYLIPWQKWAGSDGGLVSQKATAPFFLSNSPSTVAVVLRTRKTKRTRWGLFSFPGSSVLCVVCGIANLHNGRHFKMVSTSTPRIWISIATRDFAAFQRTPTREQMSFAIILQNHALLSKSDFAGLRCSPF